MTPLIGAGISIFLICLLLVLRVPMLVAVMAGVFSGIYFSDAWAISLPQTMMSGLGRFVLIALPRLRGCCHRTGADGWCRPG